MSPDGRAAVGRRRDDEALARRIARIHDDLRRVDAGDALFGALDDAGRSLEILGQSIVDDDLVLRLTKPRSVAASYVCATAHLAEAGVAAERCEQVLRRGRARVVAELAAVERRLAQR